MYIYIYIALISVPERKESIQTKLNIYICILPRENRFGVILLPIIKKEAVNDNTVVNKLFKIYYSLRFDSLWAAFFRAV